MTAETMATFVLVQLLRGALVLGFALGGSYLLRRRTASARHALWTWAMLVVLALPGIAALTPTIRIRPPAAVEQIRSAVVAPLARPAAPQGGALPADVILRDGPPPVLADPDGRERSLADLAIFAWAFGALLILVNDVRSRLALRRVLRRARPVRDPRVLRLFRQLGGVRVTLVESSESIAPATAGVFRPVVVIPCGSVDWSEERLRQVMLHELAHVRRRDCFTHAIASVVCAVHWCNPLVWMAARRMTAERERACDDHVLARGTSPHDYVALLIDTARAALSTSAHPRGVMAMSQPSELEHRIVAILDPRAVRGRLSLAGQLGVGALFIAIASALSAVSLEATVARHSPSQQIARVESTAPDAPVARTQPRDDRKREPDQRGDSIASPSSERLTVASDLLASAMSETATLSGPDSLLSRALHTGLLHVPLHEGDLVRERAAWALSQARGGALVGTLIARLDDTNWRARTYAAWALALSRDERVVPSLLPLLSHPVWRVRAAAAYALRDIGDARASDAMSRALSDDAWQVRAAAVEFIAAVGSPDGKVMLRPLLADRHIAVRLAAQTALGAPQN